MQATTEIRDRPTPAAAAQAVALRGHKVNVFYGAKQALFDIDLEIGRHAVTSLIGPSGCGKSTFLRCFNRMNDPIASCRVEGEITLGGEDISDPSLDVWELRARVGMVFHKPNPSSQMRRVGQQVV